MGKVGDQGYRAFPKWAVDAVVRIYDQRSGGYDTVDRGALAKILNQFPNVSEEAKSDLASYAAMVTR